MLVTEFGFIPSIIPKQFSIISVSGFEYTHDREGLINVQSVVKVYNFPNYIGIAVLLDLNLVFVLHQIEQPGSY